MITLVAPTDKAWSMSLQAAWNQGFGVEIIRANERAYLTMGGRKHLLIKKPSTGQERAFHDNLFNETLTDKRA